MDRKTLGCELIVLIISGASTLHRGDPALQNWYAMVGMKERMLSRVESFREKKNAAASLPVAAYLSARCCAIADLPIPAVPWSQKKLVVFEQSSIQCVRSLRSCTRVSG